MCAPPIKVVRYGYWLLLAVGYWLARVIKSDEDVVCFAHTYCLQRRTGSAASSDRKPNDSFMGVKKLLVVEEEPNCGAGGASYVSRD
jgi:hypothetical protein